ncbi:transcription factor bHLH112-like [Zingiber officinale]|uniref:transcription factor bHLH112-like n=1 Tax=Zingiber officinale TaxID=94328 RepID=UPI001C4DB6C6|nr:transcription factor bHLH112-like [Zingiber officinale]
MANQFQSTSRSWRSTTSAAVTGSYNQLPAAAVFDASSSSCDESPGSISSIAITFQDMHVNSSSSNSSAQEVQALDFGLLSPSNSIQWNQPFFGRGDDSSFHALLQDQEDMARSSFLFHDDSSSTMINNNNTIPLIVSSSCDRPMLQKNDSRLMTQFIHHPHNYPVNYQQVQELNQSQLLKQQVARSNLHPSDQPIVNSMGNSGVASSSNSEKKGSSKKPRLGTSSSLATFKVRKEKLGDRITALQQLVSPFGKTDTASVLHEAIEYIKFLHNQVRVSSSPYLKNVHKMQRSMNESEDGEGEDDDLRSKGLCLVPISSTKFAVANHEVPSDFWGTPNLGAFR